ncbi:MAG: hypothetical protein AB1640_05525 [bacterium]
MTRSLSACTFIAMVSLVCAGCGGSNSSGSQELSDFIDELQQLDPGDDYVAPLGNLTDLGDLVEPGGDHWYYTRAAAMNDAGTVVGQSNAGSPVNAAFRWDPPAGPMTFLGIHSGTYDDHYDINYEPASPRHYFIYSEAAGINSAGTIICNSTTGIGWPEDLEKRAFVVIDGVPLDLPPETFYVIFGEDPEGNPTYRNVIGSYSEAVDVNERGELALTVEDRPGEKHAYFWDGSSSHTETLQIVAGENIVGTIDVTVPDYISLGRIVGEDSHAVAINENHHGVVNSGGTAVFCDLNWGVVESLNHLPIGGQFDNIRTDAVDINDSRYLNWDGIPDPHIIGHTWVDDNADSALDVRFDRAMGFLWDGGAMYPVGHLGGGRSQVSDLNNNDQVVGASTTADGSLHAFVWTLGPDERGAIQDLGTLGGANSFATAINEAGQIVGYSETGATYREGGTTYVVRHAFLWDDGEMYDLGIHNYFYDYPFVQPYPFSEAVSINASGQVAGNSITINSHYRGFFLSPVFP